METDRFDSNALLALSDANLAEASREMARWHVDHEIFERGDCLLVRGADAFPFGYGNCAMALGAAPAPDAQAFLEQATQFFAEAGRGFTLWVRVHLDGALEKAAAQLGLAAISESPGMVLEAPCASRPLDAGLRVAEITRGEEIDPLGEIEARSYATMGLPAANAHATFATPERILGPQTIVVVGHCEGAPAAAAVAILTGGVAGLYWVATVPEARGRGLGEACTRLAGNLAFERGAAAVFLQASKQGEPIYRRMGYREITRYRWLVKS